MADIVIAGAARTPVGAFNGGLASLPAHKLGEVAIVEALRRAEVEPREVSEVIMGQILAAGEGQNPARQAAIAAGMPFEVTAYGVNQLCGSGLRTVALGWQAIRNGDSEIVVAGGQESMSQAPHCIHLRNGVKMGDAELVDTMIRDGLWDAFNGYHMGNTAENVAQRWQITREQQDAFAVASQAKAEAAQKAGRFNDEIVPVKIATRRGETIIDTDEHPKHGTTIEVLAKLRPAFDKNGTVTAGNASGINDGVAAERGGNCELTRPGETVMHRGIAILGPLNPASAVPFHASQMYGSNMASFLKLMVKNGELTMNREDEIIRETLVTYGGEVVNPRVSELLGVASAAPAAKGR